MPAYKCKCGNLIDYSEIPNPNEYLLISDKVYDNLYDNDSNTIPADKLYFKFKHILKCNHCKRLLIFWDGFNTEPKYYSPD